MYRLPDDHIRETFAQTFPNGVMTIVSVVLGVALAFNVEAVKEIFDKVPTSGLGLDGWLAVLRAFFVLLLSVGTFHMYQYTTAFVFAPPSILSNLPVFWIGASLATLAVSITGNGTSILSRSPLFDAALVTFYSGCLVAFWQTYLRTSGVDYLKLLPKLPNAADVLKSGSTVNFIVFALLAIIAFVYWFYKRSFPTTTCIDFAFIAFNIATLICAMYYVRWCTLEKIYRAI